MLILNVTDAANLDERKLIIDKFFGKLDCLTQEIQADNTYAQL